MIRSSSKYLGIAVILHTCIALQACTPQAEFESLPHVVFIMADDMGWGDVEVYNAESLIPTPNINQLAAEGMVFTDAHAGAAVCTPTRYGVMTGRYLWRTYKRHSLVMPYDPPIIPPERLTWGRLMQESGYTTAYIGKWHLGLWYPAKRHEGWRAQYTMTESEVDFSKPVLGGPTELGFDFFFGNAGGPNNDSPFVFIKNDRWEQIPTEMTPPEMVAQPGVVKGLMASDWDQEQVDVQLTEEAVGFIRRHVSEKPDQPFFLYYSLSAPHIPFTPPDFIQGASEEGPRGDMNALVDWMVGEVRSELERLGMLDNTLFIFTSDNGPRRGANGHKSAGPYRGYKNTAYEGGHRVPFVVRWPEKVPAGESSDVPLSLTDMMATFAEFVQYELPDHAAEDSYTVLPAFFGDSDAVADRHALVAHTGRGDFAIRSGAWKLIELQPSPRNELEEVTHELYNLEDDPFEEVDQAANYSDKVHELRELLNEVADVGLRFLSAGKEY